LGKDTLVNAFHENLDKQHPNGVLVGHLSLTKSTLPPPAEKKTENKLSIQK
jgi:hypothetical protein